MQQLVNDVAVIGWQHLAHVASGVAVCELTRQIGQVHQRVVEPLGSQLSLSAHERELLVGIVDERAQVCSRALVQLVGEEGVHAFADDARAVVEDVRERLELSVDVAYEVLGAAREVEDGLEVDDFGVGSAEGGELL